MKMEITIHIFGIVTLLEFPQKDKVTNNGTSNVLL